MLLLFVCGGFLGAISLVVADGAAPMVDEWVYIDAARRFAVESSIEIAPISYATAAFEAVIGGLAIKLFGDSLTVLIFISALLSLAAGIALWDLLRRSGAGTVISAAATASMLFSGLFFGLSATFMTDAHAVALATIAAALVSRGLDGERARSHLLLLGSTVATVGYFSRPGVLFVLAGVLAVSIKERQLKPLILAATVPIIGVSTHLIAIQTRVFQSEGSAALSQLAVPSKLTMTRAAVTAIVLAGLFVAPLAPAIAVGITKARLRIKLWTLVGVLLALVLILAQRTPPLLGNWLSVTGLFPIDESTIGAREPLIGQSTLWLVIFALVGLTVSALTLAFSSGSVSRLLSAEVGLWAFAGGSIALVLVSSVPTWGRMLDRYLVVLLPGLLLTLVSRSLVKANWRTLGGGLSLVGVVIIGAIGVVLAIDGMRLQNSIHRVAQSAAASGISAENVDGGAAWVGFTYGLDMEAGQSQTSQREDWWRVVFAPDIAPRYFVHLNPTSTRCSIDVELVQPILGSADTVSLVDSACISN